TILSHSLFNCLLLFILLHFHFSFFFNATATTEIYTLSLHDALPIFGDQPRSWPGTYERAPTGPRPVRCGPRATRRCSARGGRLRSEEHTSELQSRENLVCRLLLEKKKKKKKQNKTNNNSRKLSHLLM